MAAHQATIDTNVDTNEANNLIFETDVKEIAADLEKLAAFKKKNCS